MQYSLYTVSVTNNSNVVTGAAGTKFLTNVRVGYAFKIKGDPTLYQVAAVISDTELRLSVPYAGSTVYNSQYQITTDYTPNFELAEINIGDQDWPFHLTVGALRKIDSILGGISTGLTFIGSWNASTNSPPLPAASSANAGHIYKVSVTGTTTINGISQWYAGDSAISNGTIWIRVPTPETDVLTSAQEAAASAASAATSATTATTKAGEAATSATNAANSASSASSSAVSASNSAATLAASLQAFQQTFLGRFATDPLVDNQGNPLLDGTTYINTVSDKIRVYSAETSTWKDYDEAAQTATTSANLAATNAAASAVQAAGSASTASTKATEALTSATNAATSANTATTKANDASSYAQNAMVSMNAAAASASTASTKASEASTSAAAAVSAHAGTNTHAQIDTALSRLANTSGTNTGDQDLSGLVVKATTVNGHPLTGNVTVTAFDVGLGNVDNTSDLNKPVSTATQSALDGKSATTHNHDSSYAATSHNHDATYAPVAKGVTNGNSHGHSGGDGAAISLTSAVTGVLPIANGGTGSNVQNFVDLTSNQTIGGIKTFSNNMEVSGTISSTGLSVTGSVMASTPNNTAVLFSNAATTGYSYIDIRNTGGAAVFAVENSTGNTLQAGTSPYDTVIRAKVGTGITLGIEGDSAGSTRISSTGLSVAGSVNSTGNITSSGTISGTNLYVTNTNGITLSDNAVGGFLSYGYNSVRTNAAYHVWYNGISSELMRLTSSGNLLIGTTTYDGTNKLQVGGRTKTVGLQVVDNISSEGFSITPDAYGNTVLSSYYEGYQSFAIAGTERMRLTSSGNLLVGTTTDDVVNKLQVNGSVYFAGNVGIGIIPTAKLHIAGNLLKIESLVAGAGALIQGIDPHATAKTWRIGHINDVSTLQFSVDSVNSHMILTSSGNLLVGTPTDDGISKLRVLGSGLFQGSDSNSVTGGQLRLRNLNGATRMSLFVNQTDNTVGFVAGGSIVNPAFTWRQNDGTLEHMRLTASGNLLVGTATDDGANKLQVNGGIIANSFTCLTGEFSYSGFSLPHYGLKYADFSGSTIGSSANLSGYNTINFFTQGQERCRVSHVGNLLVGTATDDGANKLQVNGNIAITRNTLGDITLGVRNTAASTSALFGCDGAGGYILGGNHPFYFYTNSAVRMTISASGNLLVGTATDDGANKLQVNGKITFYAGGDTLPTTNGFVSFSALSETQLRISLKGADGTVRSTTLTLS